jgi:dsDNA-specific endonuclease/ATPase MutS2
MQLQVNDTVRELNDVGTGKVLKVLSTFEVLVLLDDGFERKYKQSEVVKVMPISKEMKMYGLHEEQIDLNLVNEVEQKLRTHNKSAFVNNSSKKIRQRGLDMEVDLHIENLLDTHRGMTNGEIIMVQLNVFEKSLRRAMSKRFRKIVFIHGVGQGVLRSEIRRLLADCYPNTEYYDADYLKYGVGGTEVLIRYH